VRVDGELFEDRRERERQGAVTRSLPATIRKKAATAEIRSAVTGS